VPFLRFEAEAQELFDRFGGPIWSTGCGPRRTIRSFSRTLAKYRSLMLSLALILHLIDGVDAGPRGPVLRAAAARVAAALLATHMGGNRCRAIDEQQQK